MIKMEGEKRLIFNLTRGRKKKFLVVFYVFWIKTIYFYQVLEDVTISLMEEFLESFLIAHQSEIKNILIN